MHTLDFTTPKVYDDDDVCADSEGAAVFTW